MRFESVPGKLRQLQRARPALWLPFLTGWLNRRRNGFVPCVVPGCDQLLRVPWKDFYESYFFFCENPEGCREVDFFLTHLGPTEVLYDIGAFRGVYSLVTKCKLKDRAAIHAFEPLPNNFEALQRLCELNSFKDLKLNFFAVG